MSTVAKVKSTQPGPRPRAAAKISMPMNHITAVMCRADEGAEGRECVRACEQDIGRDRETPTRAVYLHLYMKAPSLT